jgi:FkbM family methyltransferase
MRQLALSGHLREMFELLQIDTVLDVGANTGQYRDFLRHEVGFHGSILSFEPVGRNVQVLRQRVASDARWRVLDCALGDHDGQLSINVMRSDDFSSFLAPASGMEGEYKEKCAVDHTETVAIRRLDGLLDEALAGHSQARIYLKMDTQGFDLKVVEGADGVLHRVRALQTEVAVQRLYQGMPDFVEAIQTLSGKGFEVTGLFPVSRDARLRVVEFDCIMINGKIAD